jgi:hypothetical protein
MSIRTLLPITSVSFAIPIAIRLIRIFNIGAVIARISEAVAIRIPVFGALQVRAAIYTGDTVIGFIQTVVVIVVVADITGDITVKM